jgi:luciferase-like monooxygenase
MTRSGNGDWFGGPAVVTGVLRGLWSAKPVRYQGRHFRVADVTFLPPPAQGDSIPIWCGGYWPHKRPYRRAARFDGIMAERAGGAQLAPNERRAAIAFVIRERA